MADKLQLENAGDEATITIVEVKAVQTKFGDKVVFVGVDDDGHGWETPLISDLTADKQLSRLGLDRDSAVAETLTFRRAPNPSGKPYWNIDVATPKATTSKRIPSPQAVKTEVVGKHEPVKPAMIDIGAMQQAYLQLWDTMAAGLSSSCQRHEIALTADAVQAAAATLWIAVNNRGAMASWQSPAKAEEPAPQVKMPAPSGKRLAPPQASAAVRGSPAAEPDFSKFPAPNAADDDLPF